MGKKKINPRNKPRSEADVRKAFDRGQDHGILGAYHIMLYVLKDKLKATDDEVKEFARLFSSTVDSLRKNDITLEDLKSVCREEFELEFVLADDDGKENER